MNKCFITKLPSSVDNDNLPVLGQLRINWLKQSNLTDNDARAIGLATNDSITVKVSGAHLTDNTLTSNLGNTKTITSADGKVWLYISNDSDAVLTIDNKYSLRVLDFIKGENYDIKRSVCFDIADIKYCSNINSLRVSNTPFYGDISNISNMTNLANLTLDNTDISGDISVLSKITSLQYLNLSSTKVSGDISVLSKFTKLGFLMVRNTQINGDISAIRNLTNLQGLDLQNSQVSGDIANLTNLTKLGRSLQLTGTALTGDVSKIPANVNTILFYTRPINTNFTWTAGGRQNAKVLIIAYNIPFDTASMDNMLIDQATCTFTPDEYIPGLKVISVRGTRTSASDAAVAALQNKGITISGVTKQA